jgi:hypothetical protein
MINERSAHDFCTPFTAFERAENLSPFTLADVNQHSLYPGAQAFGNHHHRAEHCYGVAGDTKTAREHAARISGSEIWGRPLVIFPAHGNSHGDEAFLAEGRVAARGYFVICCDGAD